MSNHTVRVTMKENVVVDGVKYKAITAASDRSADTCTHCAFRNGGYLSDLCEEVNCISGHRKDGRPVYFEVKPKKVKDGGWIAVNGVKPDLPPGLRIEWVNKMGTSSVIAAGFLTWGFGLPHEVVKYRPVPTIPQP